MIEPIDPDAARRVLRRAMEIDAAKESVDDALVAGGGVSSEALIEAGAEVGIDRASVREALALERFEADRPESQALDGLAGSGAVAVEHVVARTAQDAIADIEEWLTVSHRMRCVIDAKGALDCRPKPGMAASIGRSVSVATGEVNIKHVDRISVVTQPLDDDGTPRTLVRIIADRSGSRRRRLAVGTASGAAGVGTGAAAVAATGSLVFAPVALPLVAGGYLLARSGSTHADRVELELMRVAVAVGRGEAPVGLIGRARRSARRATATSSERREPGQRRLG